VRKNEELMQNNKNSREKEFIGILFKCCNVYSRIYINKERTAFVGWCPKCTKKVEIKISPTGSPDRFFEAE